MSYRVPYARPVYGDAEVQAVVEVLTDPSRQLVPGPRAAQFETRVAALFGHERGCMVNSGSSANLLALASLGLPLGSKVLTPALTFATVVAPIIQLGLRPVFVDVEPGSYVMRPDGHGAHDAVMLPLLLGNVPRPFACEAPLIMDACDTLGVSLPDATLVTTSFYASHVITAMGGGGMVCGNDLDRVRLLANWGRLSTLVPSDAVADRFTHSAIGLDEPYDAKFVFTEAGYNMQATEAQAAFGLAQLDRLDGFLEARRANFGRLCDFFAPYAEYFVLPTSYPGANWLAFPLTVRPDAPFSRLDLVTHLEAHSIQTRPIMAGNVLMQPGFAHLADEKSYPVADSVMRGGVLIGCHQGLTADDLSYVEDVVGSFLGGFQ